MADMFQVGNSPGNGAVQILGERGDVRAALAARQTVFTITPRQVDPGNTIGSVDAANFPDAFRLGRAERTPSDTQNSPDNIGDLELYGSSGQLAARLSGDGTGFVGGGGTNGNFKVLSADGEQAIYAGTGGNQSLIMLGRDGVSGHIVLYDSAGQISVAIDGATGDITIGNADCAEEFDVDDEVIPGAVVVLGSTGRLSLACESYDSRVIGIVSGLAQYRPGLVLDSHPSTCKRLPVAVVGKVNCLVDADFGPVKPGSLLTSSPRAGYAMVARDRPKAFGSVIGKALSPLSSGQGIAQVLVMNR